MATIDFDRCHYPPSVTVHMTEDKAGYKNIIKILSVTSIHSTSLVVNKRSKK